MSIVPVVAALPGIFYQSPAPDQPPFKKPGDTVNHGDSLGVIEVMKTFTPVQSEISGTFVRFLLDSEDAVMPGQAVCEIEI